MPGGFGVMVRYTGLGSGFFCFFGGFWALGVFGFGQGQAGVFKSAQRWPIFKNFRKIFKFFLKLKSRAILIAGRRRFLAF